MKKLLAIAFLGAVLSASMPIQAMCSHIGNLIRIFGAPVLKASPFIGAYKLGKYAQRSQDEAHQTLGDFYYSDCKSIIAKQTREMLLSGNSNYKIYTHQNARAHAFSICRRRYEYRYGYSHEKIYAQNISYAINEKNSNPLYNAASWDNTAKLLEKEFNQEQQDKTLLCAHFSA